MCCLSGSIPGVRSAQTGHHFAGFSNRFWKLLYESGWCRSRSTFVDDDRLTGVGLRDHQPDCPADARDQRSRGRPNTSLAGSAGAQDPPLSSARRRARRRDRLSRRAAAVPGRHAAARGSTRSSRARSRRPSMARACSCCRTRAGGMRTSAIRRCSTRSARSRALPAAGPERAES